MPTGVYIRTKGPFTGKTHSKESRKKMEVSKNVGEKNPAWKGQKAGYTAKHFWLKYNFGKAIKCENVSCPKTKSNTFQWALIKGKKYEHKRENYIQL